ncbi:MAG: hypothetical protein ABN502_01925 [Gammaproteobacteria bacterium]
MREDEDSNELTDDASELPAQHSVGQVWHDAIETSVSEVVSDLRERAQAHRRQSVNDWKLVGKAAIAVVAPAAVGYPTMMAGLDMGSDHITVAGGFSLIVGSVVLSVPAAFSMAKSLVGAFRNHLDARTSEHEANEIENLGEVMEMVSALLAAEGLDGGLQVRREAQAKNAGVSASGPRRPRP